MADDIFSSPLIILLVIMFLFALLIAFGGRRGWEDVQVEESALLSAEVGEVGGEATSFRHVNYPGFAISHTGADSVVFSEIDEFSVARGAITQKEKEIRFIINQEQLSLVEQGRLTFNLVSTSSYGALQIYLNGKQIYSQYPEQGKEEIDLAAYGGILRAGENTIRVKCTSSGWRLWAPTEYVIESFTLLEEAEAVNEHEFDFTLSEAEAGSSSLGRLVFNIKDAQNEGDLVVEVNDVQVWEGRPSASIYNTEFSGTLLKSGENTLNFKVLEGGRYSFSRAELVLSYGGVKTYEFNITKDQLKKMREDKLEGFIELNIQSGSEDLTVTLVAETEKVLFSDETEPGKKRIRFVDSDVVAGKNTISLSSDGLYTITDLRVLLWPKE